MPAEPLQPFTFEFFTPPEWKPRMQKTNRELVLGEFNEATILFLGRANRVAYPEYHSPVLSSSYRIFGGFFHRKKIDFDGS